MEFTKVKNYVDQIDNLIRHECTGTADEFAQKLGVSERTIQNHIRQLRDMDINIIYNRYKRSYCYAEKGFLTFCFTPEEMNRINGGEFTSSFLTGEITLNKYEYTDFVMLE